LQERDEAVERWLRDEVAPAFDKMKADPKRGVSAKKVFTDIRARHASRSKAKA
jgi:antitoxin ParD1/3/4